MAYNQTNRSSVCLRRHSPCLPVQSAGKTAEIGRNIVRLTSQNGQQTYISYQGIL